MTPPTERQQRAADLREEIEITQYKIDNEDVEAERRALKTYLQKLKQELQYTLES